jgi:hypothetical protein
MTDSDNELEDLLASINKPIRQMTKEELSARNRAKYQQSGKAKYQSKRASITPEELEKKRIADSERYKRLKQKDTTRKYEHGAAARDEVVLEMAKGKRRKDMTDEEKIAYRRQKTREFNKRQKAGENKTPTWAKDAEILERIQGKRPREMTAEERKVYLNAKRRDSYNKSIGKEIVEATVPDLTFDGIVIPPERYEQRLPPRSDILRISDITDI